MSLQLQAMVWMTCFKKMQNYGVGDMFEFCLEEKQKGNGANIIFVNNNIKCDVDGAHKTLKTIT
jgi:hypothetical protein